MDTKNYILILHKPDGCTTCRGCVMDSWGSAFSLDTNVSETDAINKIAESFADTEYGNYTAHLICPNSVVYEFEQSSGSWPYGDGYVQVLNCTDDGYVQEDEDSKRLHELIWKRVAEVREANRIRAEKAAAEEARAEAERHERYEREQLEKLKQKYKEV